MKFLKLFLCMLLAACFTIPAMAQSEVTSADLKNALNNQPQYKSGTEKLKDAGKFVFNKWKKNIGKLSDSKNDCIELTKPEMALGLEFEAQVRRAAELSKKRNDDNYKDLNTTFKIGDKGYTPFQFEEKVVSALIYPEYLRGMCYSLGKANAFPAAFAAARNNFILDLKNGVYDEEKKAK